MITRRVEGLHRLHFILQVLIVTIAYWFYLNLFVEPYGLLWFKNYLLYCVLIFAGLLTHEIHSEHDYQIGVLHGNLKACHNLVSHKVFYAAAFLAFYLLATKDRTISRFFLFSFLPVMYVLLFITDWWVPGSLAKKIFKGLHEQRLLLIGSSIRAEALTSWLTRKELLGVRSIGLLNDERDKGDLHGVPILGSTDDLEHVIREQNVTHVILLEFPFFPKLITHMVYICDKFGVRLLMVDSLEEHFLHPIIHTQDDGIRLICIRDEPLQNPVNRLLKRFLDIVISLPVVLFVLPVVTFVVWFFQRLQSPGPIFYWQPRAGLQNKEFSILKYRTMHVDNPDVSKQATVRDERVYPAGRFFRKFSIDELPQFWNVLHGEMSVVGPRPHLVQHNEQFARIIDSYYIRGFVKPGITGLAQIKGFRGETKLNEELAQRIEYDLYYIENWSVDMEFMIIFKTFGKVLFPPKTAY